MGDSSSVEVVAHLRELGAPNPYGFGEPITSRGNPTEQIASIEEASVDEEALTECLVYLLVQDSTSFSTASERLHK